MKTDQFPDNVRPHLIPEAGGELFYRCLGCQAEHGIESLLYTCPDCGKVLLIHDRQFDRLKAISGETWRQIFDYRRMLKIPALKGIYRYHEFIGPVIPLDAIIYLGEGHMPGPLLYAASLVFAMIVAGIGGLAIGIPCLRLRGDYLAIATLGFGEIVRIAISNSPPDWLGGSLGRRVPRVLMEVKRSTLVEFRLLKGRIFFGMEFAKIPGTDNSGSELFHSLVTPRSEFLIKSMR